MSDKFKLILLTTLALLPIIGSLAFVIVSFVLLLPVWTKLVAIALLGYFCVRFVVFYMYEFKEIWEEI